MAARVYPHHELGTFGDDDLLAPAMAAAIAERSIRTIRRAYSGGSLPAYRDGGGRGVRIRYADLRDWLLRSPIEPVSQAPVVKSLPAPRAPRRSARQTRVEDNLALLNAARERRRRERAGAAGRGAAGPPPSAA